MPSFTCARCNNRTFDSKASLNQHLRMATNHPYCDACERAFTTDQSLEQHTAARHPPTFRCNECSRTYKSERGLVDHYRGSTAHPNCERCGVGCKDDAECAKHYEAAHPRFRCGPCGGKLFFEDLREDHYKESPNHALCAVAGCHRGFVDDHAYDEHAATAHSQLRCHPCKRQFLSSNALQEHYQLSPAHPSCDQCGYGVRDDEAYRVHVQNYHDAQEALLEQPDIEDESPVDVTGSEEVNINEIILRKKSRLPQAQAEVEELITDSLVDGAAPDVKLTKTPETDRTVEIVDIDEADGGDHLLTSKSDELSLSACIGATSEAGGLSVHTGDISPLDLASKQLSERTPEGDTFVAASPNEEITPKSPEEVHNTRCTFSDPLVRVEDLSIDTSSQPLSLSREDGLKDKDVHKRSPLLSLDERYNAEDFGLSIIGAEISPTVYKAAAKYFPSYERSLEILAKSPRSVAGAARRASNSSIENEKLSVEADKSNGEEELAEVIIDAQMEEPYSPYSADRYTDEEDPRVGKEEFLLSSGSYKPYSRTPPKSPGNGNSAIILSDDAYMSPVDCGGGYDEVSPQNGPISRCGSEPSPIDTIPSRTGICPERPSPLRLSTSRLSFVSSRSSESWKPTKYDMSPTTPVLPRSPEVPSPTGISPLPPISPQPSTPFDLDDIKDRLLPTTRVRLLSRASHHAIALSTQLPTSTRSPISPEPRPPLDLDDIQDRLRTTSRTSHHAVALATQSPPSTQSPASPALTLSRHSSHAASIFAEQLPSTAEEGPAIALATPSSLYAQSPAMPWETLRDDELRSSGPYTGAAASEQLLKVQPPPMEPSPITPSYVPPRAQRIHCRICARDPCVDLTATLCGHVFCNSCITDAVIAAPRCPVCRNPTLLYCLFRLDLTA